MNLNDSSMERGGNHFGAGWPQGRSRDFMDYDNAFTPSGRLSWNPIRLIKYWITILRWDREAAKELKKNGYRYRGMES